MDDRLRARGVTVSMYGEPLENGREVTKDVYAENEELKEEIQKLAGQIQYVKIVGMLMDNHHIKEPKRDGYFSRETFTKSILENTTHYCSTCSAVIKKDRRKRGGRSSIISNSIFSVCHQFALLIDDASTT